MGPPRSTPHSARPSRSPSPTSGPHLPLQTLINTPATTTTSTPQQGLATDLVVGGGSASARDPRANAGSPQNVSQPVQSSPLLQLSTAPPHPPSAQVPSPTSTRPPSSFRFSPGARLTRAQTRSFGSLDTTTPPPDQRSQRESGSTSSLDTTGSSSAIHRPTRGMGSLSDLPFGELSVASGTSRGNRSAVRGVGRDAVVSSRRSGMSEDEEEDEDEHYRQHGGAHASGTSDADSEGSTRRRWSQADQGQPGPRERLLLPTTELELFHAKKKRTRVLPTAHQSAELNKLLAETPFPSTARREELGRRIGLSARKVQVWFQNRRQKARRDSRRIVQSRPASPRGVQSRPASPFDAQLVAANEALTQDVRLPPLNLPPGFSASPLLGPHEPRGLLDRVPLSPPYIHSVSRAASASTSLDRRIGDVASQQQVTPPARPAEVAWEEGATSTCPLITASRSAIWGTSPDNALRDWTFFLPIDRRMFGRLRKQPQDTRAIFSTPNCDVWKCEVEFSGPSNIQPDKVAVKVLRHYVPHEHDPVKVLERMNARLNLEAITWAGVDHPNVVPLIGTISSPIHALILPWYNYGNLGVYLRHHPAANRLNLIDDIAKGLENLHSRIPMIVHGDIKPENVLINDQGHALLTDFGMATVLKEDHWYTPSHLHGGTFQWMAPEVFLGQRDRRSRKGDVYSFGSLICYIMTDRIPHGSRSSWGQICDTLKDGRDPIDHWHMHPQLKDHVGVAIAGIIRRCWSDSQKRPRMSAIVEELASLIEDRESLVPRRQS